VLDGGASAVLPLPRGRRVPLAGGDKAILGVRPEHFSVAHRARTEAGTVRGTIHAPVEVVEPTGSETMVVLRLGGREVTARVEPEDAPTVGQQVELSVNMSKACLFDPASEVRL
jgi:multiple sugar transport system ATP-binding protein